VGYYDGLPKSLRTTDTERNRAMALARLALVTSRQGDFQTALPMAREVVATLEKFRRQGDQSDGTIYALGLALEAQRHSYHSQSDFSSAVSSLKSGAEILRPFANSAEGSRRIKLQYANILNYLSHAQPKEQGVAMCEEALHILAGLGALDLSDLSAASAWADVADSEARQALELGRLDDAERLEKQVQTVAEGVLARRPGDLRAKLDLFYAADMLSQIEEKRFHDADSLRLAIQSRQAAEEYLRFNPSDTIGWQSAVSADYGVVLMLSKLGRIAEAVQSARAAALVGDNHNAGGLNTPPAALWVQIAFYEAQRGNRGAADGALQGARRSIDTYTSVNRMPKMVSDSLTEIIRAAELQVRRAFGEDAIVYANASQALSRLDALRVQVASRQLTNFLLSAQRLTLEEATRAALNLENYGDAETNGRILLALQPSQFDDPDAVDRVQVRLAQALVGQGRKAEALKILEPALAKYQDLQTQGASYVQFRQHFARALYVQSLAEPTDSGGLVRRREELDRAAALLLGLTDEAKQLHDSKELVAWIGAAQKKLNPDGEAKQP
jgi:hypothetical protein